MQLTTKKLVLLILCAFFLGVVGSYCFLSGYVAQDLFMSPAVILLMVTICSGFSGCLLFAAQHPYFESAGIKQRRIFFAMGITNVLFFTLILFLLWLPILLLMTPFSIGPDTVAQLLWTQEFNVFDPSSGEILGDYDLSDYFPFLITLTYGFFYDIGQNVTQVTFGMTLLVYVQAIFTIVAFAYTLCWMGSRGVPAVVCWVSLVFFAFSPLFAVLVSEVAVVVTSMPFFLFWILIYLDFCRNAYVVELPKIRRVVALVIFSLLCSLVSKTFFYIVAISLFVLLIFMLVRFIAHRKSLNRDQTQAYTRSFMSVAVSAASCVFTIVTILPMFVFPLAKIAPGGPQEFLAVPIQQVAAVVALDPTSITADERSIISEVLPYNALPHLFSYTDATDVKNAWNTSSTPQEAFSFFNIWLQMMPSHMDIYTEAVSYLDGFFQSGTYAIDKPIIWYGWSEFSGDALFPGYFSGVQSDTQEALDQFLYEKIWSDFRVFPGILFDLALYCTLIPAFGLTLLILKHRQNWMMLLPLFISWLMLFLSASCSPHYAYNLIFAAPLFLAIPYIPTPMTIAERDRARREARRSHRNDGLWPFLRVRLIKLFIYQGDTSEEETQTPQEVQSSSKLQQRMRSLIIRILTVPEEEEDLEPEEVRTTLAGEKLAPVVEPTQQEIAAALANRQARKARTRVMQVYSTGEVLDIDDLVDDDD